jgi:uroporphyrinogen decarboxylase
MNQSSRNLLKQTLEFQAPRRVPRHLWTLPWAASHYPQQLDEIHQRFPDDIVGAPYCLRQAAKTSGDQYQPGVYIDEWGCTFFSKQAGYIGEVKDPLVAAWSDLDKVRPPEEFLTVDIDQVNAFCRSTDCFVLSACCARPFERLQFIRRSDNLYLDLGEQTPELEALLRKVHEFYLKELELWAGTEVDGLMCMDDWGSQRALLISPKMWRSIFKPLYKEYIDLAHSHGKYIFFHSDGYIADILPDLVELGLDAVNSQLFTMDIEELGRQHAGKITFWGELDRQHLLPYGTPADIDRAVRRVHAALYREGGAIAQCEFGVGARPENVYQMFQTWEELV